MYRLHKGLKPLDRSKDMTTTLIPIFFPTFFIFMVTISYATSQLIWLGFMALVPIIKRSKDNGAV